MKPQPDVIGMITAAMLAGICIFLMAASIVYLVFFRVEPIRRHTKKERRKKKRVLRDLSISRPYPIGRSMASVGRWATIARREPININAPPEYYSGQVPPDVGCLHHSHPEDDTRPISFVDNSQDLCSARSAQRRSDIIQGGKGGVLTIGAESDGMRGVESSTDLPSNERGRLSDRLFFDDDVTNLNMNNNMASNNVYEDDYQEVVIGNKGGEERRFSSQDGPYFSVVNLSLSSDSLEATRPTETRVEHAIVQLCSRAPPPRPSRQPVTFSPSTAPSV